MGIEKPPAGTRQDGMREGGQCQYRELATLTFTQTRSRSFDLFQSDIDPSGFIEKRQCR